MQEKPNDTTYEATHTAPAHSRSDRAMARAGVISTPHGQIQTPAFIPVGTRATVKTLPVEHIKDVNAQAVLCNGYHLYLQPGHNTVDAGGGLAEFMGWGGPTFTDSGGFQVMSLGSGFKKMLSMDLSTPDDDVIAAEHERMAHVDDNGVTFTSHIDGSAHRFTPAVSMTIQHGLGADIIMAFDELTTLMNTRGYQEDALERTRKWAIACLHQHNMLTKTRVGKPKQSLWGIVQGAQYEDLRRKGARDLVAISRSFEEQGLRGFGGYAVGGALIKETLGEIVSWATEELPDDKPRHMLGISEPDDVFAAIAAGIDTFDCVNPSRLARRGTLYTLDGKVNLGQAKFANDHSPIDETSSHEWGRKYTHAYLHHLVKTREWVGGTIVTALNLAFTIDMVAGARQAIVDGRLGEYRDEFLGRFYSNAQR